MKSQLQLELISFDICPYVQRSVITLKHKRLDFKLTYIDLAAPPAWFNELSPLGKVPVLKIRDPATDQVTVLFESAVINEYIDEVTPPVLAQKDPLKKAFERAWVEVGGELLGLFYRISVAKDPSEIEESRKDLWDTITQVEKILPGGKTFRGQDFSLVDAAFAPAFMRMNLFRSLREAGEWSRFPKVKQWSEALLGRPEVRDSVIPEFKKRMQDYLIQHESLIAAELG